MSELAKKLRSEAHDENGYGHPLTTLLLAAADEIAKLQAALEAIAGTAPWSDHGAVLVEDGHIRCLKIARAALQQKEGEK